MSAPPHAFRSDRSEGSLSPVGEETLRCAQVDGLKPSDSVDTALRAVKSDANERSDTVRMQDAVSRPGSRNRNPPGITFLGLLAEDLRTHDGNLFEQGFWAVATHRLGNWRMGLPKVLRLPFTLLYRFLFKWVEWTCGITLPYTVQLGRRGIARKDALHQLPIIEDRVDLGCGIAVLGAVTIGHDSMIGANAVVLKDVPPWSVAVGVPAKVIRSCQ
jgi:serine O-acetyltransferase